VGGSVSRLDGEGHHWSKLTDAQVEEIRSTYSAGGHTQKSIAKMFGVSQPNISLLVRHINRSEPHPHHRGNRWYHTRTELVCTRCGIRRPVADFTDVVVKGEAYKRRHCKLCENVRLNKYNHAATPLCKQCGYPTRSTYRSELCRPCEMNRLTLERQEQRRAKQEARKRRKVKHKQQLSLKWKTTAAAERNNTCQRCGLQSKILSVFDFHHLDPASKNRDFASIRTWTQYREELQKCVMLCSNCHRIIHWLDRHPEDKYLIENKGVN
jgi:predicted transcriptional regulator